MTKKKINVFINSNPILSIFILFFVYSAVLCSENFFSGFQPDEIKELITIGTGIQVVLAILLTTFVYYAGWWKQVGFIKKNPGGLKFIIPPFIFQIMIVVMLSTLMNVAKILTDPSSFSLYIFIGQVIFFAFVGYTEELMFRGIMLNGFLTKINFVKAAALTGLIFGLFHYINMFGGASFLSSTNQAIQASVDGFMYATLRLRIGSIIPLMAYHGLLDLGITNLHSTTQVPPINNISELLSTIKESAPLILASLVYGIFVLFRYKKFLSKHPEKIIKPMELVK